MLVQQPAKWSEWSVMISHTNRRSLAEEDDDYVRKCRSALCDGFNGFWLNCHVVSSPGYQVPR
jgi:hypothetical protein